MNRIGLLFGICLSLFACGGSDPPADPLPPPSPAPAPALAQTARLSLTVIDVDGRFVEGATVSTAAASAVTSSAGTANVDVHSGSEQTVRIAKDGFAEQVKVVNIANGSSGALQSMLIARQAPQTLASNEAGGSVSGKDGVKVTLPAGAFVTADGQAVSGAVQLSLTPVDVTQLDIGAFPGLFEGVPSGGTRSPIVTYGTAELVPQQGGQKLHLAAGKSAEIELPFYVKKHQDGTNVKAGDTVPLWSLDTASGLWQQEGEGTVVLSVASPSGFALRASISHFSWWNIDAVSGRGMVNLVVNVSGSTAPVGTTAAVEGRVVAGSGPGWLASITVPVGTATQLAVSADATTELTARAELNAQVCTGSVNVNAPANTTVAAVINAICVDVPVPRIVTPSGVSSTNSERPVRVQVMVDGPVPDTVELFAGGTRIEEFGREFFFYTAWWDSSTFAEGRYLLTARATLDGGTRTSAPVEIVVDRTPPRMVNIAPAPGTALPRTPTFTVDFSEPVHSFPFELTDAVKLAVFPVGSSTPVEIPIEINLSNNLRRLTVQAQAALPLGDVNLTWGGLQDAARNAVTGIVTARYSVDRSPQLFTQAQRPVNHGPPLAITNGGQIVAAWAVGDGTVTGGTVHVGVRSGNGFTLFGAPADNPTSDSAGDLRLDMTLDAADRPHIAYTQIAGANNHIVVRRFDNGVWQTLGAPFTGSTSLSGPPRLLVDPAGRPVLAFLRNYTVVEVHRYEAATNTWTQLGSLAAVFGVMHPDFDFALMPNGDPVVAIIPATIPAQLQAARYNGTTWVQLGGVIDTSSSGFGVRIVGGTNGPWLHYHKVDGTLRLLRFNGSGWEARDIPKPAGANIIQSPLALGLLNDNPIVVFNDFNLGAFITRFINGNFEPNFPSIGRPSQLSIATRGNMAIVGAQDFGGNVQVHQLLFP